MEYEEPGWRASSVRSGRAGEKELSIYYNYGVE